MYDGCQLRERIEMKDLLCISRSVLTSSGAATLCNDVYCSFCNLQWYVLYSSWWLLINISPSIPIGERLTAMKSSMAGKGTTRDGLKMEQQVFMVGIPLCMYASW